MTRAPARRAVRHHPARRRTGAGLSYSIEDRLRILHKLDQLGVPFVEGGWPGANPRDTEFFRLATGETLKHATLTAFGMTRKAGETADRSAVLRDLLDAGTEVVCLVGKAWDLHVTEALRTDLDEGAAMVRDSIAFLRGQGRRVFFDAEHFFDGYRSDPAFALRVLASAEEAGAERLVLCDTNGGMLPNEVARVVAEVRERVDTPLGIHVHNDAGCAVANSLIAVEHGAFQVQGVVNGYGERTGNADLIPIAANLVLKMGAECLPEGRSNGSPRSRTTWPRSRTSPRTRASPTRAGTPSPTRPGCTRAASNASSSAYEHVEPSTVGNRRGVVASDLGGAATIRMKAEEFGLELGADGAGRLLLDLKDREARGYTFEVADASLELLMRRADGWRQPFFEIDSYRVHVEERVGDDEAPLAEATVKVVTKGTRHIESAEGQGPVGALDNALRKALANDYPELEHISLEDFRVRVLDEPRGLGGLEERARRRER